MKTTNGCMCTGSTAALHAGRTPTPYGGMASIDEKACGRGWVPCTQFKIVGDELRVYFRMPSQVGDLTIIDGREGC